MRKESKASNRYIYLIMKLKTRYLAKLGNIVFLFCPKKSNVYLGNSKGHLFNKSYFNSGQKPLLASIMSSKIALATFILGTVLFKVNACNTFS